jgi:hypothetical protein
MKMKEIKNLRMNDELKVIKSLYYMSDDCLRDNEWYSKEDIFESCFPIGMYETHEEIKNAIFGECILTHGSLMIRKKCLDCVTIEDTYRKIDGTYAEYEKSLLNANKNHMLIDLEQVLDNWINETDSFVSEDGVVESWSKGKGNDEFYKNAKENIKILKEKEL